MHFVILPGYALQRGGVSQRGAYQPKISQRSRHRFNLPTHRSLGAAFPARNHVSRELALLSAKNACVYDAELC